MEDKELAAALRERLKQHRYQSQSGRGMRGLMGHHIEALVADLTPFIQGLLQEKS